MNRVIVITLLLLLGLLFPFGTPQLASAQVKGPGPYVSDVRDQCIAEMAKDAQIRIACQNSYSDEFHDQDARRATRDQKHVVMAYGALWAIMTVFIVMMWMRQRKLSAEITRLEDELSKAIAE